MMILITYDVETQDRKGRKRLRTVAKMCEDYGQRVQNSVFECVLDQGQFTELRFRLIDVIDKEKDSLRFYHLGSKWSGKVEHVGTKSSINPETDCLYV
ncbi:MAG: CRISPR-associated endonuclease Cas2 [Bacteroidales bacterium]|nr:CRISPR-associated endonuclease Cas2 [Bacteroidales bacterium]